MSRQRDDALKVSCSQQPARCVVMADACPSPTRHPLFCRLSPRLFPHALNVQRVDALQQELQHVNAALDETRSEFFFWPSALVFLSFVCGPQEVGSDQGFFQSCQPLPR
jgi:hypothetical protein